MDNAGAHTRPLQAPSMTATMPPSYTTKRDTTEGINMVDEQSIADHPHNEDSPAWGRRHTTGYFGDQVV